jgi:hypothetical protein
MLPRTVWQRTAREPWAAQQWCHTRWDQSPVIAHRSGCEGLAAVAELAQHRLSVGGCINGGGVPGASTARGTGLEPAVGGRDKRAGYPGRGGCDEGRAQDEGC